MFGNDSGDCPPEGGGQSPQRAKLLQQIIEMLMQMPDKEAPKPDGGALEIEVGGPDDDMKKGLG